MNENKATIFLILIIALGITGFNSFFIVTEGKQAIVTHFGDPVGEPVTTSGVHFKVPFIHDVRYVDKRILSWDGFPNQIPTKDKKYIKVDTTARWRVNDALLFIKTVQNEQGAKARLDTILDGHTRDVISGHNLVETVRNSNDILDIIEQMKEKIKQQKANNKTVVEEEITGEIEAVKVGREALSQMIARKADKELQDFGIELIDVQLRRISYESSVEKKVYERMISERQRVAQKIRSIGKGEKAKIEGRMEKDLKEIESSAYRKAEIIKGNAEAKATKIYANALSKDPKFYEFIKTMETYQKALKPNAKFILSSDSEFLKFLK